jgi:twitching motility protein PilT
MQDVALDEALHKEVVNTLGRTPMFRALKPEQLTQLVAAGKLRQFGADETILRQDEASDSFAILLRGRARLFLDRNGQAIELSHAEPPELLGIVGVVLEQPRPATVKAAEPTLVLLFAAKTFVQMYQQIPGFGLAVTRGFAEWLKEFSAQIPLPRYAGTTPPGAEVLRLLPMRFLERHRVLPLQTEGASLTLGFVDDPQPQVLAGVRQLLPSMEIRSVRIDSPLFDEALRRYGGLDELQSAGPAGVQQAQASSPQLDRMIERMAEEGASDLHLTAGRKPSWRIDGRIVEMGDAAVLGPTDVLELFEPVLERRQLEEFHDMKDVDFSYAAAGVARVRVNLYRERHGVSAAMRFISSKILNFEQLGLPLDLSTLCQHPKGLVLVTGPTGSGKSTTLAAMVDHINRARSVHILTLEDPIEFVHSGSKAMLTQREMGSHASGFNRALRAALREDPDVILVGEMRDRETIRLALEAANTGHLVFSTLHTASAVTTVDRIVDMFPAEEQQQVRSSLSEILLGVVSQTLCRRKGGGRVAAIELLVVGHAVSNLIKDGKTQQIPSIMQTSRRDGNRLLNDELLELVKRGVVEPEEALAAAADKKDLERRLPSVPRVPPLSRG